MLDSCVRCTSVSFTLEHCTDIVSLYPFSFLKKKKNKRLTRECQFFASLFRLNSEREAHGSPRQRRTAAETATTALVVATRAAVDRCGAGYGVPPFVLQGGHRECRPTGAEDWAPAPFWDLPSILSSRRTMVGPPLQGRGPLVCWSLGRRRRSSGTAASGTSSSSLSMLLCCRWWTSCRMFTVSSPRVCRLLPRRLSMCPRSLSRTSRRELPVREPQLAEQLVEVPTILYLLKQRISVQIVDNPVPRGRGRRLQGFLPRQSPTAQSAEQLADVPIHGGGLQGSRPGQNSAAHC